MKCSNCLTDIDKKYITVCQQCLDDIESNGETEIADLKDKIKRRNKQIKNLKRKIEDLLDTEMNAHGETLRLILANRAEEK